MARIAVIDLDPSGTDWIRQLVSSGQQVELVADPAEISSAAELIFVHAGTRISAAEETCWQIRDLELRIPVVTASPGEYGSEGARLVAAGARDHVSLPAHPQDLRFRLEAHLSYARELVLLPRLPAPAPGSDPGSGELSRMHLLDTLVQAVPSPILAANTQGRLLLFNGATERLLGCTRELLQQEHHVGDFFAHQGDVPRLTRALSGSSTGQGISRDLRVRTMLGEQIPVRFYGAGVFNEDGRLEAFVGLLQDMREINTLTQRLEDTTRQLIDTELRAKEVLGARNLAHELNQPLTVAMGSIELVASRTDLPEAVIPRLDRIYQQLSRMAAMVKTLPYDRYGVAGGTPRSEGS